MQLLERGLRDAQFNSRSFGKTNAAMSSVSSWGPAADCYRAKQGLLDWAGDTCALPQNTGCCAVDIGTHRVSWCKNPWEEREGLDLHPVQF